MKSNQQIYEQIPRKIMEWSNEDVALWFNINNITFQKPDIQFDGRAFVNIQPEYLMNKCKIGSMIITKKIIEWIEMESEYFDEYVIEKGERKNTSIEENHRKNPEKDKDESINKELRQISIPNKQNKAKNQEIQEIIVSKKEQLRKQAIKKYSPKKYMVSQQSKKKIQSLISSPKKQQFITQEREKDQKGEKYENNHFGKFAQSSYQTLSTSLMLQMDNKTYNIIENSTIGRLQSNKIVFSKGSISRRHAEILKIANEYYLKDLQSSNGTFVEVDSNQNRPILEGDIYRFGDSSLQIIKAKINKNTNSFDLKIKKEDVNDVCNYFSKRLISVGNKLRDICLNKEDPTSHYADFILQNGFIFLDKKTEDCYLRLPKLSPWRIQDQNTKIMLGFETAILKKKKSYEPIAEMQEINSK